MRRVDCLALCVLLAGACSGGDEDSAAPTSATATTAAPATDPPATTEAVTTTTLDMRSVEVPPGAPPLPLYSGDPVLMTEALFEFLCWVDQHPVEAGVVADLYSIQGSDINAHQRAEQARTSSGGLVLQACLEVIEVTAVATPSGEDQLVMANVVTTNPVSAEVGPDGVAHPLPTWARSETLVPWRLQADGRWLTDDPIQR